MNDNKAIQDNDVVKETLSNETMIENEESAELTYDELIANCVGYDALENPKAGFSVEMGTFDGESNTSELKSYISFYNPYIDIIRTGDVLMMDFIYNKKTDMDLRTFWSLLNKYGKDFEQAIQKNSPVIPLIRIQIVPTVYCGKISLVCVAPMYWALQPATPTSEINTIRIAFSTDSVGCIEGEGFDESQILAELEREEMQREYIEEAMEREREEREAYQEERNARLEELRRQGKN